jgi:hypothetical protein
LLTIRGSSGLGPLHGPAAPHRRTAAPAASGPRPAVQHAATSRSGAASFDRSAAFHVQKLLSQQLAHGAPRPGRETMLAAYHAPLARGIRYFGPLTPVDLRV